MSKLKITKNQWSIADNAMDKKHSLSIVGENGKRLIADIYFHHGEGSDVANAQLIIDAGNTANDCGYFPSELLRQSEELLKIASCFQALDLPLSDGKQVLEMNGWNYSERYEFSAQAFCNKILADFLKTLKNN